MECEVRLRHFKEKFTSATNHDDGTQQEDTKLPENEPAVISHQTKTQQQGTKASKNLSMQTTNGNGSYPYKGPKQSSQTTNNTPSLTTSLDIEVHHAHINNSTARDTIYYAKEQTSDTAQAVSQEANHSPKSNRTQQRASNVQLLTDGENTHDWYSKVIDGEHRDNLEIIEQSNRPMDTTWGHKQTKPPAANPNTSKQPKVSPPTDEETLDPKETILQKLDQLIRAPLGTLLDWRRTKPIVMQLLGNQMWRNFKDARFKGELQTITKAKIIAWVDKIWDEAAGTPTKNKSATDRKEAN